MKMYFISYCFLINIACQSQSKTNLPALKSFLCTEKVIKSFKIQRETEDLILVIDDVVFKKNVNFQWGGKTATIIYDSVLLEMLKKQSSSITFKDKCGHFYVEATKQGQYYYFNVMQACTNVFNYGKLKKVKNKFKVVESVESVE